MGLSQKNIFLDVRVITHSAMRIHLVKDYVRYCISTPRRVPLRFQEMVDSVIADLIKCKVITREEGPSEWCSPAFFVPKPDG